MYFYIDCFFYSFIMSEKKVKNFKLNNIKIMDTHIKINNLTINYLNDINYIESKNKIKNLKSFKSIRKNLNQLIL